MDRLPPRRFKWPFAISTKPAGGLAGRPTPEFVTTSPKARWAWTRPGNWSTSGMSRRSSAPSFHRSRCRCSPRSPCRRVWGGFRTLPGRPHSCRLRGRPKPGVLFFPTITSDALQSLATCQFAADLKLKNVAVIYVNNDYGVNLNKEFAHAFTALGGTIVSATPYNERQASYQPEVTKALASKPEALYLIGYPTDGATIVRTWISLGGAQKFLLNDGLNSDEFIKAVGPRYLAQAYGTSSGTPPSASTRYFAAAYPAFSNFSANAPGADRAYDAAALIGLAIAWAGKADSASIRDGIRRVLDPQGAMIGAGPDEFKRGLALIEERKPIRYNGLIGPVQFDKHGDITGPFIK